MRGKDKCRQLKQIRKMIAENNDIEYAVSECTYKGECKGTCPKCEAELQYLEQELAKKQRLGKRIAVAGIAATLLSGLIGCTPEGNKPNYVSSSEEPGKIASVWDDEPVALSGDIAYVGDDEPEGEDTVIEEEIGDIDYISEGSECIDETECTDGADCSNETGSADEAEKPETP